MFKLGCIFLLIWTSVYCDERGPRVRRIVGGAPANIPPADDPVVYTRFNGKTAAIRGVLDYPHYAFRGIRFAKPPVGNLRFVRPQETFLEGFVNATTYPPPCIQPIRNTGYMVGQEDCLFLNIFTPDLPTGTEGLPVLVWIHGGGFRYGSASQYGVKSLVGQKLVVVTIQYRLGSLGFLSGGTKEVPGNAALWDMALAIQWVKNYIGFFGGNPFKITISGHGSGASSALLVALSQSNQDNSAGVVAMSGTAISHWAIDETPVTTARSLAERNGCITSSELTMFKCLQGLDPKQIIAGDSDIEFQRLQQKGFQNGMGGGLGAAPVNEGRHDGRSLPRLVQNKPMDDMEKGNTPKIPLLLGTTKDETKRACTSVYKNDIVDALTTIPNFLEKELISSLQGLINLPTIPLFPSSNTSFGLGGLFQALDPGKFRKYIEVPVNDFEAAFSKIAEATTDALFNVPAFLTANMWSKGGETFMYKFEHAGKMKKGNFFLNGFSLGGDEQGNKSAGPDNSVSHGDELAYLFDPQHIDGTPAEHDEKIDPEDEKVKGNFARMVADFARGGKVKIGDKPISPFSGDSNSYIQITPEPKLIDNFEFCKMGLWLGIAQRLQSSLCGFLNVLDSELNQAQKTLFNTVNATEQNIDKTVDELTKPLDLDLFGKPKKTGGKNTGLGLLGGKKKKKVDGTDEKLNGSLKTLSKPLDIFSL